MQRYLSIFALSVVAALTVTAYVKGTNEPAAAAEPSAAPMHSAVSANNGSKIYKTNCSSCHQADGHGMAGVFPSLAGNSAVTGDPKAVIHIVKYGLTGKITVGGKTYAGTMPALGSQLSNHDVASVITYIRSTWGNKAGAVTAAQVAAVAK